MTFRTELARLLIALEVGWREDRLEEHLETPLAQAPFVEGVVNHYRDLPDYHPGDFPIRTANFERLVEMAEEASATPRRHFRVLRSTNTETVPLPSSPGDTEFLVSRFGIPFSEIIVQNSTGPVLLRSDQVLATNRWGIGYTFEDHNIHEELQRAQLRKTAAQLARQLNALLGVESRWRARPTKGVPIIFSDSAGREFEDLLLDILNEEVLLARRASIREDFHEKTDLRVKPPGLERKHGARVQVTQIIDVVHYQEKLSQIRRLPEFVILSPISLAGAVFEEGQQLLGSRNLEIFWASFPSRPSSVSGLAWNIKSQLANALRFRQAHPLGPMGKVPSMTRLLIRNYVVAEAFRSTNLLRERQGRR